MTGRALLALLSLLPACATVNVEAAGFVAAEGRAFPSPPKYPGQETGNAVSLVAEPQLSLKGVKGQSSLVLRPFYRLDPADERRSHFDIREAKYRLSLEHFELQVGSGIVTWGVLESYRPTDVINQTDFVESVSGTAKLGQPFLELGWVGENTSFKVYALPWFRERTFPGLRGRLRFPALVDVEHPQFESPLRQWRPSGAARFTFNVGDFDVSASLFTGTSREPRFIVELSSGQVVPRYDLSHQVALDAQWTLGAVTFKAEGFARLWSNDFKLFGGGGVGVDYTFFKFAGEADLTLAAEFLFDTRPPEAPITFFQHDAFAGLRLAINDVSNTEVNAGAIIDVVDGTTFGHAEASRRFGEHWRLTLAVNFFLGTPGKLDTSFGQDNHGEVKVAYFF
jgi:hypothetical protein